MIFSSFTLIAFAFDLFRGKFVRLFDAGLTWYFPRAVWGLNLGVLRLCGGKID